MEDSQASQATGQPVDEGRYALSLLDAITRGTGDLIAAQDREYRYLYFNDAYAAEFGRLWGRDIQVGTSMVEALSAWPEEQRKAVELWKRALAGEAYAVTMEFGPSDEQMQVYDLRFNPIFDRSGNQIGAAHILRNVTERARMQQALRHSEQLLRRVLDNLFAFVGVLTPDGTLIQANRSPLAAAGIDAAEVIGRKFWDCYWWTHSPEEQARLRDAVARASDGEVVRYDALVRMANDSRMWIDFQLAPLRDDDGRILYLIPSGTDITSRRLAETELRRADARKNDFLATLAHELRNPLAPLRNGLALLSGKRDAPELMPRTLEMMQRQLSQMTRLIDDLLDISRITGGKLTLRSSAVDVRDALRHAVEMTMPQLAERQLDLSLPEHSVQVEGDPHRLTQVFGNLLHNAAKFTSRDGHIRVECAPSGDRVEIRISDDGEGIPPERLESIFELYSQLDTAPDPVRGGLGIGLSLVKHLVALHRGTVRAHSAGIGQGARFEVCLPVIANVDHAVAPAEHDVTVPKGTRALVVDDNRDAADSLATVLRLEGLDVSVAYSGSDAVATAARFQPRVILLDLGMPGQDGYETCRALRAADGGERMMIVALSGFGMESDRMRSAAAGFAAHLLKPVDHRRLMDLLASLLSP